MIPRNSNTIGRRVLYIPLHAAGDMNHPDIEKGVVTSYNSFNVFVRFDTQPEDAPGRSCDPEDVIFDDTIEPEAKG